MNDTSFDSMFESILVQYPTLDVQYPTVPQCSTATMYQCHNVSVQTLCAEFNTVPDFDPLGGLT